MLIFADQVLGRGVQDLHMHGDIEEISHQPDYEIMGNAAGAHEDHITSMQHVSDFQNLHLMPTTEHGLNRNVPIGEERVLLSRTENQEVCEEAGDCDDDVDEKAS